MKVNNLLNGVLLVFCVIITGCLDLQICKQTVEQRYINLNRKIELFNQDFYTIKVDSLATDTNLVLVEKKKSTVIPAIFFWHWDWQLNFKLSNGILLQQLKETFKLYADSADIKNKLNGKKIVISINKLPLSFMLIDRSSVIIYPIGYFMYGTQGNMIYPIDNEIEGSYQILNTDGTLYKFNRFMVSDFLLPQRQSIFSKQGVIDDYLDRYEKSCKMVYRELLKKIIADL